MNSNNSNAMLTVAQALELLVNGARPIREIETISAMDATGRVLAADQHSTINVPDHDNTSMDGYALRAADCVSGQARLHVAQRIAAGGVGKPLESGTAARIFTGAPIPPGADAVVMQEMTQADGEYVIVQAKPAAGEWIRRVGEDIKKGSVILRGGTKLRPQETGLAASVGIGSLPVFRKLRVGIFFTGDELCMPGEPLPFGKIYNSSRYTLTSMIAEMGGVLTDFGIIPDSLAATRETLRRAVAENDLVLTSGGVSVGEEDHVKPAVEAEGRLDMWKIAMKPGKPLAFGQVRRGDGTEAAFIGLPGNPVSSFVCMLLFVRPFVLRSQGVIDVTARAYSMRADFDWLKADSRQEFLRVRINDQGGLEQYPNQSSAVLTSTVWGDGLVDNPAKQVIKRGDSVRFLPFAGMLR